MFYPVNDDNVEETKIKSVNVSGDGWIILCDTGYSFCVPGDSQIVPEPGMTARFHGKGKGYAVRGLFLDDVEVFYSTEMEAKEKNEIDMYGADTSEWLSRWDEGKSVWSIEMGGLGPGYEQAIQITCAETIRHLLKKQYDESLWDEENDVVWKHDRDETESMSFENPIIKNLGLLGAQWGAAFNLALKFYRNGPIKIMNDVAVKDRHIQVSRVFP